MGETTVEQRLAALEKEITDLRNESHKTLQESAKAMIQLQQRLTSLRGPEGGRGEKGETGAPGKDGLSEQEIRSIILNVLRQWEQDFEKNMLAQSRQHLASMAAIRNELREAAGALTR